MNNLYVVRDVVSQDVGNQVIVAKRDEVAVRAFFDALGNPNPQSVMAQHPEDFELICIGKMQADGSILDEQPLGSDVELEKGDLVRLGTRLVVSGKLFVQMREAERAKAQEAK